MSDRIIAGRYAGALYDEAQRSDEVSAVDADVALLKESLASAPEFARFLRSPIIARDKKRVIVEQLLGKRVRPLTMKFVRLLIENERENVLPDIVEAYRSLRDEQEGILEASATFPATPNDADKKRLTDAVENLTGKRVRLSVRQDPAILGGVVVRVGDMVYDGSVLHQLQSLREQWHAGNDSSTATNHRP